MSRVDDKQPAEAILQSDSPGMVIRETRGMCPVCLDDLPARVVERPHGVFLERECPRDGFTSTRLSRHPDYYTPLDRYYFSIMPPTSPQRDYLVRLTERCNLNCPICLASANEFTGPEYSLDDFKAFLDRKAGRRIKIDLISAEPTLREDLPEFIRAAHRKGHIVALHTNGLRLVDRDYLHQLKQAGLDEVHLQMDGFEDHTYQVIRGQPLAEIKLKALENLEAENIATDLVMVIMPGVNEHEIAPMLDYCRTRPFVRELFFLGYRSLGRGRESDHDHCLMPDDVIDLVEQASGGKLARRHVFRFQKLYFALLAMLGVRKCLYVQHYLLIREAGGSLVHVHDLFNWERLEAHLDRLPEVIGKGAGRRWWWMAGLFRCLLSKGFLRYAFDFFKLKASLIFGFDLSGLGNATLLIGYITACDPFIYDEQIAALCGKGELSCDVGIQESGSFANITRERQWAKQRG